MPYIFNSAVLGSMFAAFAGAASNAAGFAGIILGAIFAGLVYVVIALIVKLVGVNWINKLKQQFPNWMFIHPDSYKNVDGKIFEDKERVYFFTDYLNHASYMKFIAALRGRKVPFDYLGSRNVESMIRQVFEDTNPGR